MVISCVISRAQTTLQARRKSTAPHSAPPRQETTSIGIVQCVHGAFTCGLRAPPASPRFPHPPPQLSPCGISAPLHTCTSVCMSAPVRTPHTEISPCKALLRQAAQNSTQEIQPPNKERASAGHHLKPGFQGKSSSCRMHRNGSESAKTRSLTLSAHSLMLALSGNPEGLEHTSSCCKASLAGSLAG